MRSTTWLSDFIFEFFYGPLKTPDIFREFGMKSSNGFRRNEFLDVVEFTSRVIDHYDSGNQYISVAFYNEPRLCEPKFQYLYYDFDREGNVDLAVRKALEFTNYLRRRFNVDPVLVKSGFKGLHVLVPLNQVVDFSTYSYLWEYLTKPFNYEGVLDTNVKEPRRLHRIPYTWNVKEGDKRLCYIVDYNLRKVEPKEFKWSNYNPLNIKLIPIIKISSELLDIKELRVKGREPQKPLLPPIEELGNSELVPPCIRNLIDALVKAGDLDHNQRIALVLYLKWVGFSVDDVVDLFRKYVKDFKENITRYQVEFLYGLRGSRKDYIMYSCDKLKALNICVGCGWGRNPVTYTYARASVPREVSERFFNRVRGRESKVDNKVSTELHNSLPPELIGFLNETKLSEFSYEDFRKWLEGRKSLTASEWHYWERLLRKLAEDGKLGRKFLVGGEWVDYGPGPIKNPPSKEVRFYVV